MIWRESHRFDRDVVPIADRLCLHCGRPVKKRTRTFCSRTCCNRHHAPDIAAKLRQPAGASFWFRTEVVGECWEWRGSKGRDGYGHYKYKGKLTTASRVAYQLIYGDIGPEFEIHHKCENRGCVRPEHLEALSTLDHSLKTPNSITYQLRLKTHCPAGHEYNEANTHVSRKGSRNCRECHRQSYHRRKARTLALELAG